jgi:hypothetical protein
MLAVMGRLALLIATQVRKHGMELSDGIDFYEWNATVRALSAAIERLERVVENIADIACLASQLEELNLHLQRQEEAGYWLPRSSPTPDEAAPSGTAVEAHPLAAGGGVEERGGPSQALADEEFRGAHDPQSENGGIEEPTINPEEASATALRLEAPRPAAHGSSGPVVRFGDPEAIRLYGRPSRRR